MLPAQIVPDVTIENVRPMFNAETFSWVGSEMGKHDMETLGGVKYAIVHRFEVPYLDSGNADLKSAELVNNIAACLRLIRPMRQFASLMVGNLRPDGTIEIQTFSHPVNLMDVPQLHKGFSLRNRDIQDLQSVANAYLRGMNGQGEKFDFEKFRMAVSFHDTGHFAVSYWKSRFILWCSAIEGIYTSQNKNHQGSNVAKERINGLSERKPPSSPLVTFNLSSHNRATPYPMWWRTCTKSETALLTETGFQSVFLRSCPGVIWMQTETF